MSSEICRERRERSVFEGMGTRSSRHLCQKRVLETRLTPTVAIRIHKMDHRIYITSSGHRALAVEAWTTLLKVATYRDCW